MKKFLVGAIGGLVLLALASPVLAKPEPKVNICHRDGSGYHLINVSGNAVNAHLAHGDGFPGGTVPGTNNKKFTDDCKVVDKWTLVETLTVNSYNSSPTLSSTILENGKEYKIEASGTWLNTPYNWADAEYTTEDSWITFHNGYDISPWFLGEGEFDLQVNGGFVDWGPYTSTHIYDYLLSGNGSPASFLIFDGYSNTAPPFIVPGWYSDNQGSLSVSIYSN